VLRSLAIVGAAALIATALYLRPTHGQLSAVSGAVIGVLALILAVGQISGGVNDLTQTQARGVSAESGRDACIEQSAPTPDLFTVRLPFALWLRRQMRAGDVYSLAGATPPPDRLCLYSVLLPALPAVPGETPRWTIAFGSVPHWMQSRANAHDPAVHLYFPGFALQSDR
jgi:hypothetical protein